MSCLASEGQIAVLGEPQEEEEGRDSQGGVWLCR